MRTSYHAENHFTEGSVAISNEEQEAQHFTVRWDFVFYGGERGSTIHGGAFWPISRSVAFGVGLFGGHADG